MELVRYDAMCQAIQTCHSVDEVKELRDKAIALEAYAKQAMNTDAERQACEIRLRAERRAGKLLSEKRRNQGGNGKFGSDHDEPNRSEYQQAKQTAGISDTQAKRWQKLASINEQDFEQAMADPDKPSTTGIIKKSNGNSTRMHPKALWLWGRLRDFEREQITQNDPAFMLGEMTTTMQADIQRIAPLMIDYLQSLLEEP